MKKNVKHVSGENKFQRNIDSLGSDMLVSLAELHFDAKELGLAEAYCLKHLAHLETLHKFDLNDIYKRKIWANLCLGHIYLKQGEPEVAVNFLKTHLYNMLNRYYYEESVIVLPPLVSLYNDLIRYLYKEKDFLKVLDLCGSFFKTQELVNKKRAGFLTKPQGKILSLNKEDLETIQRNINFVTLVFSQVKEKYPAQVKQKIASSTILTNVVHQINFNFDNNSLTLEFKNIPPRFLIKAFKAKKIEFAHNLGECFIVDISQCTTKQLERVCQYALDLHNQYLTRQAEQARIQEAQKLLPQPTIVPTAEIIPAETTVSQPNKVPTDLSTPRDKAKPKPSKPAPYKGKTVQVKDKNQLTRKVKNNPVQNIPKTIEVTPASESPVRYEWPCGLVYDSTDNNEGQVKKLSNSFLPDNLWFGYIPDWLKEDKNYNQEFDRKLKRGKIGEGDIRDILKELRAKAI